MTAIIAGQTANVKLFLRKTGSAQIDVIIEGINGVRDDRLVNLDRAYVRRKRSMRHRA